MNRLLNRQTLFVIFFSYALSAAAQNKDLTRVPDGWELPVTISVLQDVEINVMEENTAVPDDASPLSRYSLVTLGFRREMQFQMINIHLEGGCQIRFEDKEYSMISCPWLPGFRDHQEDIFAVMEKSSSTE